MGKRKVNFQIVVHFRILLVLVSYTRMWQDAILLTRIQGGKLYDRYTRSKYFYQW